MAGGPVFRRATAAGAAISAAAFPSVTVSTSSASCSSIWSISLRPRSDDAPNVSRRIFAIVSLRLAICASRSRARALAATSIALSVATSSGNGVGSSAIAVTIDASLTAANAFAFYPRAESQRAHLSLRSPAGRSFAVPASQCLRAYSRAAPVRSSPLPPPASAR